MENAQYSLGRLIANETSRLNPIDEILHLKYIKCSDIKDQLLNNQIIDPVLFISTISIDTDVLKLLAFYNEHFANNSNIMYECNDY